MKNERSSDSIYSTSKALSSEQVVKSINKYLSENQMSTSELFAVDTSDAEGMALHEICRKQLVAIFTVLINLSSV